MNKGVDVGDVHAPVEDTDVPFMLKVLIVLLLAGLAGLLAWIIMGGAAAITG